MTRRSKLTPDSRTADKFVMRITHEMQGAIIELADSPWNARSTNGEYTVGLYNFIHEKDVVVGNLERLKIQARKLGIDDVKVLSAIKRIPFDRRQPEKENTCKFVIRLYENQRDDVYNSAMDQKYDRTMRIFIYEAMYWWLNISLDIRALGIAIAEAQGTVYSVAC